MHEHRQCLECGSGRFAVFGINDDSIKDNCPEDLSFYVGQKRSEVSDYNVEKHLKVISDEAKTKKEAVDKTNFIVPKAPYIKPIFFGDSNCDNRKPIAHRPIKSNNWRHHYYSPGFVNRGGSRINQMRGQQTFIPAVGQSVGIPMLIVIGIYIPQIHFIHYTGPH